MRERESKHVRKLERGREREGERECQAASMLSAQSQFGAKSHKPQDHDLSPNRVGCLTDWATQVPLREFENYVITFHHELFKTFLSPANLHFPLQIEAYVKFHFLNLPLQYIHIMWVFFFFPVLDSRGAGLIFQKLNAYSYKWKTRPVSRLLFSHHLQIICQMTHKITPNQALGFTLSPTINTRLAG